MATETPEIAPAAPAEEPFSPDELSSSASEFEPEGEEEAETEDDASSDEDEEDDDDEEEGDEDDDDREQLTDEEEDFDGPDLGPGAVRAGRSGAPMDTDRLAQLLISRKIRKQNEATERCAALENIHQTFMESSTCALRCLDNLTGLLDAQPKGAPLDAGVILQHLRLMRLEVANARQQAAELL